MKLLKKRRTLYAAGLTYLLTVFVAGTEFAPFPSSNAPSRIEYEDTDGINKSSPSPFGILTSERWSYGQAYRRASLTPVSNPNPNPEPQPRRDHPADVALSADGNKAYVALQGSEAEPGSEIAVVDLLSRLVVKRIPLKPAGIEGEPGSSPTRLISAPGDEQLLVVNQFSNFATVIDTRSDQVVGEVPLDYYCQDGVYDATGENLYLANRYLDQVFVLERSQGSKDALPVMRVLGGMDDQAFFDEFKGGESVHTMLQNSCGTSGCHSEETGGLYAGSDALKSFQSVLEHVRPGKPMDSRLLAATLPGYSGGYADATPMYQSHARRTVVFKDANSDSNARQIRDWIAEADEGPGIPVGNPRSKPVTCAITSDGQHLFVANTGTQSISIVDTKQQKEVAAIYVQNAVVDLVVHHSKDTGKDYLIASLLGVGFGVTKERDPFAGESWDRENPAAQYSVWRDTETGRVLPREEQEVLGPFDTVDGTLEVKFRDIQNDILFVDISRLNIPEEAPDGQLEYILMANKYEAHKGWTRYTSDTAESTYGDIKGDIPPALMRVVGAYPDQLAIDDDRLFVTMQGSNIVQEWQIDPQAVDPINYLSPIATYPTGFMPKGIVSGKSGSASEGALLVANFLGGTLSLIDKASGSSVEIPVDLTIARLPVPVTNAERGEVMAHTSFYSSDGDTSCIHCHTRDMSDGRAWGVSQVLSQEYLDAEANSGPVMIGGSMNVPQMRGLFGIQPFFFEGVISGYEPRSMIMEHCPSDDFKRPTPQGDFTGVGAHYIPKGHADIQSKMETSQTIEADLEERRDEMFRRQSREQFGKSFNLRDFQRFVGEWQMHESRLLPNPFDQDHPSIERGRLLFEDPQVGCISCHTAPHFAKKDFPNNPNQALPPVTIFTVRDGSFTLLGKNREDYEAGRRRDLEPWDQGRAETKQGHFTTFPLRGIWDRPPSFLHNGLARTLMEVSAVPGHPALGKFKYEPLTGGYPERPDNQEIGFNMTFIFANAEERVKLHRIAESRLGFDTHGGTSQLTRQQMEDLVNFMNSIE